MTDQAEQELVYSIWGTVKKDSLASSKIGHPSQHTVSAIMQLIAEARRGYVSKSHLGEDHYWHTSADQSDVGTAGVRLICDCGVGQVVYDKATHDELAGTVPQLPPHNPTQSQEKQ